MNSQLTPLYQSDIEMHRNYLALLNNPSICCHKLLTMLQLTAHIRQTASAMMAMNANIHKAGVGLIQPLQDIFPTHHDILSTAEKMLTEIDETARTHVEHFAHEVALAIIHKLESLPEVGNVEEIKFAKTLITLYKPPTPTQPNSPEPEEEMPLPIPARHRKIKEEEEDSEREDAPPG